MNTSNPLISFLRRLRTGVHQDPVRDWLALLTLSILVFLCIVIWNVWAFGIVAQGGAIGTTVTATPDVFNRSSIDVINLVFKKRAIEEAKYVTGVYRYTDPSQ